jgi:hypothetical protein
MYEKDVSRATPGCIIFVVDQSHSMTDPFAGSAKSKGEAVATAINRFIGELVTICERGEDKPRHYFDVGLIGYTTDEMARPMIGSLLQGPLAGRDLVSIVDLFDNPLDTEVRQKDDGAGGLIEIFFPVWYRMPQPDQMNGTPMCAVFQRCRQIAGDWCGLHPDSFPPVVIHLTDGASTDGNPEQGATSLRALGTRDGYLLLFNCHLSDSQAEGALFPYTEEQLPDEYARTLFRMSSPLPDKMLQLAEKKRIHAPPGARGMAFNADGTKMLLLISVGTPIARPDYLR